MSATKQQVTLAGRSGAHVVEAEVYGLWAVTPVYAEGWLPRRGAWTVTHVLSGMSATGSSEYTKAQAREIARRYDAELDPEVWGVERPNVTDEQRGIAYRIRSEVAP